MIPAPLISTWPLANRPVFTGTYRDVVPSVTSTPKPPSRSATRAATGTVSTFLRSEAVNVTSTAADDHAATACWLAMATITSTLVSGSLSGLSAGMITVETFWIFPGTDFPSGSASVTAALSVASRWSAASSWTVTARVVPV